MKHFKNYFLQIRVSKKIFWGIIFLFSSAPLLAQNTKYGSFALSNITSGINNSAFGANALSLSKDGSRNTAIGFEALGSTTWGYNNTAIGSQALSKNTTGYENTATGKDALFWNTYGTWNTANGAYSLAFNTSGVYNTAIGGNSLYSNTSGTSNTGIGRAALYTNTTGSNNTALGSKADVTASNLSNATAIGYNALVTASNNVVIGNSSVLKIGGYQSWTKLSDFRFKKNIQQDVHGLDFIMQLVPVTYNTDVRKLNTFLGIDNQKEELQQENKLPKEEQERLDRIDEEAIKAKEAIRYTGFIAQDVEKAAEKVGYNFSGVIRPANEKDHYSMSYEEFVVPLVKAVQEQQVITEQQKANEQLLQRVDKLEKLVSELTNQPGMNNTNTELNDKIELKQNNPNPFTTETSVSYYVPKSAGKAQVLIYSSLGELVKTFNVPNGNGVLKISANDLKSGLYNCTLNVNNRIIKTISIVKQ